MTREIMLGSVTTLIVAVGLATGHSSGVSGLILGAISLLLVFAGALLLMLRRAVV